MYQRKKARFKICKDCGRKIRLTRFGLFRRHVYPKGVVCSGSWARPTTGAGDVLRVSQSSEAVPGVVDEIEELWS